MNPVCKICGAALAHLIDPAPEYCGRCDPEYPKVKLSDLERLERVPAAYRKLVEFNVLYTLPPCGDVDFLCADALVYERELCDAIRDNPHLQPFAKTAGGDWWCWTAFRVAADAEPEIFLIEDSFSRVVVYAPNFGSFLYRTALEDADGNWVKSPRDLDSKIADFVSMSAILRRLGNETLADDLDSIIRGSINDYTPSSYLPSSERYLGWVSEAEVERRIERFLGTSFVNQKHRYTFLKAASSIH